MTVSSTSNRKTFTGDAVTTSFATSPMVFFNSSELTVYVVTTATGAVVATLTENTHYTVTGGSGSTGTVSLAGGSSPYGAPAASTTLVIVRTLPLTQTVDLVNNDGSDAEVAEDALDKLVMIAQQLDARVDRAIVLPDSDVSGASMELPSEATRASKVLGFDADGAVTVYSASSAVTTADNVTFTSSGGTSRTVQAKLRDFHSLADGGTYTSGARLGLNTNANSGNLLRIHQDTGEAADQGVNNPVWIQRTVGADEGATNPKALRVSTVVEIDTDQTEWTISAEQDSYSDTASSGNAVISATANKYGTANLIGAHINSKDMSSYDNYADVTAVVGIEAHARGIGLDHQTANSSLGKRLSIDVVAGTSNSTPTWSEWQANTPYDVGDHIVPTGTVLAAPYIGFYYVCTTAGTTGATEPSPWGTTIGGTTSDNTAVWTARRGAENGCAIRIHNDNGGTDTWGYYRYAISIQDQEGGNTNVMDTGMIIRTGGRYGIRMTTNTHTIADISLESDSSYGLSATGNYTNAAIRVGDDEYIQLETTAANSARIRFVTGTDMLEISNGGAVRAAFELDASARLLLNGTQVLQGQGAAVADASGGATIDAEARTAINTLLARARAHGFIAT